MIISDYGELKKIVEKCDYISFDIFDTLLIRPFSQPIDLFFYIEEKYECKGFADKRVEAENKARSEMVDTEEVSLEDIYKNIPEYESIKTIEMEEEKRLLRINPKIKEIFSLASSSNKKMIATSDIYLPESFIREVLDKNGYQSIDKLFISSTHNKEKWTGNLFRDVLGDLNIKPKQLLHIGDNYRSDIEVANSLGINAFHITKIIDDYLATNPYKRKDTQSWRGSVITMMLAIDSVSNNREYWEKFGYEYGGPICYSYVEWICSELDKEPDKVSDVIFVARDGYLLKKIFDMIKGDINTHYIYAPRSFNLRCRLDYDYDYYDCLNQMKMIISYYKEYLPDVATDDLDKEKANKIIQDNYELLKQLADKEHEKYKQYLNDQGFGNGDIIVVDTITDKFSAQKIIKNSINNRITGYYWLIMQDAINKNKDGCLYKHYQKTHVHQLISWDLMEFIMSSPDTSVCDIVDGKPIYNRPNDFEERRVELFHKIEKGVLDYCKDMIKSPVGLFEVDSDYIIDWANNRLSNPTDEDFKYFDEVRFSLLPDHSDMNKLKPFRTDGKAEHHYTKKERMINKLKEHPTLFRIIKKLYNYKEKVMYAIRNN